MQPPTNHPTHEITISHFAKKTTPTHKHTPLTQSAPWFRQMPPPPLQNATPVFAGNHFKRCQGDLAAVPVVGCLHETHPPSFVWGQLVRKRRFCSLVFIHLWFSDNTNLDMYYINEYKDKNYQMLSAVSASVL